MLVSGTFFLAGSRLKEREGSLAISASDDLAGRIARCRKAPLEKSPLCEYRHIRRYRACIYVCGNVIKHLRDSAIFAVREPRLPAIISIAYEEYYI